VLPSPYGSGGINPAYGFSSQREKEAMNDQTGKLLVVDSDDALRANLITVLGDAGYVFRAKLILALAEGASNNTIKLRLGTTAPTISRWKQRYLAAGLDGLDRAHPGQKPSVLTARLRARILAATRKPAQGWLDALELPQTGHRPEHQQGRRAPRLAGGGLEAAPSGALHGRRRSRL